MAVLTTLRWGCSIKWTEEAFLSRIGFKSRNPKTIPHIQRPIGPPPTTQDPLQSHQTWLAQKSFRDIKRADRMWWYSTRAIGKTPRRKAIGVKERRDKKIFNRGSVMQFPTYSDLTLNDSRKILYGYQHTHGQWWSNSRRHTRHMEQWWLLGGFQLPLQASLLQMGSSPFSLHS